MDAVDDLAPGQPDVAAGRDVAVEGDDLHPVAVGRLAAGQVERIPLGPAQKWMEAARQVDDPEHGTSGPPRGFRGNPRSATHG